MRRLLSTGICLAMVLCITGAVALVFPSQLTDNERALMRYIDAVNEALDLLGAERINSVFECYDSFASLGVTAVADADQPEDVEITVYMDRGLEWMELSTCNLNVFPSLCAACLAVAGGDGDHVRSYLSDPQAYANRAKKNPSTSFSDTVYYERSTQARAYFAYSPNVYGDSGSFLSAYGDGKTWLTMTLVFPLDMSEGQGVQVSPVPAVQKETIRDGSDDEGDYTPYDEGTHFEIFVTPTPEPDSAAGYYF